MLSPDENGSEERIGEIIADYLSSLQAGGHASPEAILAEHPQFEKELLEFFENDAFVRAFFSPDNSPPDFGADYEVIAEIGRGGMGIVYKAHQKSLDKIVAVKTITGGPFATIEDIERIHKEARRAAALRHRNIVTVHQVAEHGGRHFFVMDHIDGRTLAELTAERPLASLEAAGYVKTIADGIHYAHQRQILHCDLKPANILLDEEGTPYISDFGLAKRMGENAKYLPTSAVGGSPGYMAPEQVVGGELTTATDVYGLGAILYALLTGRPPFQGQTLLETLKKVREASPQPPSRHNSKVDRDLEAICLRCLDKDKEQRYASAKGVARDLGRYLAGDEPDARLWNRRERTVRWCRRNPVAAGMISAVVFISILTLAMAISISEARKDAQLREALQSNSFAARDLARTALLQLRDLRDAAEEAARDGTFSELLRKQSDSGLQHYLERICSAGPIPFASCTVLNANGIQLARVGDVGTPLKYDFSWRDYFRGARDHRGLQGRSIVHVSRVYRSKIDDFFKLAISVPVLDSERQFLGAVTTAVTTDAAIGGVILEDPRRKVAVIALRDIDDPESDFQSLPSKAVVVFHPGYHRGVEAVAFPDQSPLVTYMDPVHDNELDDSQRTLDPVDNYQDPVASVLDEYRGRWIAGFAPVGNTGLAIIVQQRYDEALALDTSTSRNLVLWSIAVVLVALTVVSLILWRWVRPSK